MLPRSLKAQPAKSNTLHLALRHCTQQFSTHIKDFDFCSHFLKDPLKSYFKSDIMEISNQYNRFHLRLFRLATPLPYHHHKPPQTLKTTPTPLNFNVFHFRSPRSNTHSLQLTITITNLVTEFWAPFKELTYFKLSYLTYF